MQLHNRVSWPIINNYYTSSSCKFPIRSSKSQKYAKMADSTESYAVILAHPMRMCENVLQWWWRLMVKTHRNQWTRFRPKTKPKTKVIIFSYFKFKSCTVCLPGLSLPSDSSFEHSKHLALLMSVSHLVEYSQITLRDDRDIVVIGTTM